MPEISVHDNDGAARQIGFRADPGLVLTDKNGTMHRHMRHGEIGVQTALVGDRQVDHDIHLAVFECLQQLMKRQHPKGVINAHIGCHRAP